MLAGQDYPTKAAIKARARAVLNGAVVDHPVVPDEQAWLLELFLHHDEWAEKAGPGVAAILVRPSAYGTRCFWLQRVDGSEIGISFEHALKRLSGKRTRETLPQSLLDFKGAAREAVKAQIDAFRAA
ncbi:MAG: DUF3223 domain-containing protein [Halochromatium sp.]|uniref:DUF3223 domain-containing protein n=1 Tax=Halochromatium sp. TaxID=2049430 RepID=UPI00397C0F8C